MFSLQSLIIVALFFYENAIRITTSDQTETAEETQHAICKVISKEINTTANATIKRELKGVCTDKQIDYRFQTLEQKLMDELHAIKSILDDLITKPHLNKKNLIMQTPKTYTYTWEIDNILTILNQYGITLHSPDFTVTEYRFYLQLYPHHLDTNYLALELKSYSDFHPRKHRFTIINSGHETNHIASQLLGQFLYRVPYEKLHEKHYLEGDTIVIQVVIYFDS